MHPWPAGGVSNCPPPCNGAEGGVLTLHVHADRVFRVSNVVSGSPHAAGQPGARAGRFHHAAGSGGASQSRGGAQVLEGAAAGGLRMVDRHITYRGGMGSQVHCCPQQAPSTQLGTTGCAGRCCATRGMGPSVKLPGGWALHAGQVQAAGLQGAPCLRRGGDRMGGSCGHLVMVHGSHSTSSL